MDFPNDEVEELKAIFGAVEVGEETGVKYLLFRNARMPAGCTPERCDLLLCPTARDGYPSRLFFSAQVQSRTPRGWSPVRILERDWYVYSWKDGGQKRLAQMVAAHLEALK